MATANGEITLYGYQPQNIDNAAKALRAGQHVLMEEPTGAGKTLQSLAVLAKVLPRTFDRALVISPQRHIEKGFIARNGIKLYRDGVARPIALPAEFVRLARQAKTTSTAEILAFLRGESTGRVLACTHGAIVLALKTIGEELPEDLGRILLVVDEAHHVGAEGLGGVIEQWNGRGGRLLYLTATPYRNDDAWKMPDNMVHLRRSLAQHMEEGWAPRSLYHKIIPYRVKRPTLTASEFAGNSVGQEKHTIDAVVRAVVKNWEDEKRPKQIIRVPPISGGSKPVIEALKRSFKRKGARVLDATGIGPRDQARIIDALEAEQDIPYRDSKVDVVIGVQRVIEGMDWPLCWSMVCLGIPGSLTLIMQLLGRAMRLKRQPGHPSCDESRITFVVPQASKGGKELELSHVRQAFLVCVFLADHEVGETWLIERQVYSAFERASGVKAQPDHAAIRNALDVDPDAYAAAKAFMASVAQQRDEISVADIQKAIREAVPSLSKDEVINVVTRALASEQTETGELARSAIQDRLTKRLASGQELADATRDTFEEVLREFEQANLAEMRSLRAIGESVCRMTGQMAAKFSEKLRASAGNTWTVSEIVSEMIALEKRTGKLPTKLTPGHIAALGYVTWNAVDRALYHGFHGLPGGSSLSLIQEGFIKLSARGKIHELPMEQFDEVICEWHRERGMWPSKSTKGRCDRLRVSWGTIHDNLVKKGTSLAAVVARLSNQSYRKKNWTITELERLVLSHYERCGEWPSLATQGFAPETTMSWTAISERLRNNGSSLAMIVAKLANTTYKHEEFTMRQFEEMITEEHERSGNWPTDNSKGYAPGTTLSWCAVGVRLRKLGTTLSCVVDRLSGRTPLRQKLSEQLIEKWVIDWMRHTGMEPGPKTEGTIPGTSLSWANINDNLKYGKRGLPGGDSLTKMVARIKARKIKKTTKKSSGSMAEKQAPRNHNRRPRAGS